MASLTDTVTLQTFSLTAGSTYTALVSVYRFADSPTVKLLVNGTSSNVATATGWTELRVTYTALASTPITLVPTSNAGGKLYFDNFLNTIGTYTGDYFDGSLYPNGEFAQTWTGTAHASTSVQTAVPVITATASTNGVAYQTSTSPGEGRGVVGFATSAGAFSLRVAVTTLTASTSYAVSGKILSNTTGDWLVQIRPNIDDAAIVTTLGTISLTAGVPASFSYLGTSPATGTWGATSGIVLKSSLSVAAGVSITLDELLVEASTVVRSYFDGSSTSADDDLETGWTGAEEGSTSIMRGVSIAGFTTANNAAAVSATTQKYSGSRSTKVFYAPTASSSNNGLTLLKTLAATTTYTASAYVYVPVGSVAPLFSVQGVGYTTVTGSAATTTAAWERISVTFTTTTAGSYSIYILNSGATSSGLFFYVDNFLLETSNVLSSYFDGTSTPTDGTLPISWTGAEHASTSVQQGATPAVWTQNWIGTSAQVRSTSYVGSSSIVAFATAVDGGVKIPVSATTVTTPSNTYTASVWAKGEAGKTFAIFLEEYTSASVLVGQTISTSVTATGSWQRLSVTRTLGATGARYSVGVVNKTAGVHTFYVDAALVEPSPIVQDYFDGSITSSDVDLTNTWSGTAHASYSVITGVAVDAYDAINAADVSSTTWMSSGSKSLRVIPLHQTSSSSYIRLAVPTTIGAVYTAKAQVRLTAPLTGALSTASRTIYVMNSSSVFIAQSNQPLNQAGTTAATVTFTANTTSTYIVLFNGGIRGAGDVWFDDLIVTAGTYAGNYFDGNSDSLNGALYEWTGAANASTSTATVDTVYAINEVTNPSMETVTSGASVMRKNLITNPSMEAAAWDGYGTGSNAGVSTIEVHSGTQSTRVAPTVSGVKGATESYFPVVGGAKYTFSAWVKREAGSSGVRTIIEWSTDLSYISSTTGTSVVTALGEWQRISVTGTAPATATRVALDVLYASAVANVDIMYVDDLLLEQTDQLRDYFDGDTVDAFGWAYAWTGTAEASSSTASALAVTTRTNVVSKPNFEVDTAGWLGSLASVTVALSTSEFYSGTTSLQAICDGTVTLQAAYLSAAGRPAVTAGSTYTASIWYKGTAGKNVRLELGGWTSGGALVGSRAFSDVVVATGSWQRLSATKLFGSTEVSADIVVRSIDATANTFYVDAVMIEASATLGDYFDGTVGATGDGYTTEWSGTVNASTSIQKSIKAKDWSLNKGGASTATLSSGLDVDGTKFSRFARPGDDIASTWRIMTYVLSGVFDSLNAGTYATIMLKVRASSATTIQAGLRNPSGIPAGNGSSTSSTVGTTWTWIRQTVPITTDNAAGLDVYINYPLGVNTYVDVAEALVVLGTYTGPYFTGAITPDGDTTVAWTGTAHDSTSALSADPVADWVATTGSVSVYRSSIQANNSSYSAKALCNGTSTLQGVRLYSRKSVSASTTYTASTWVLAEAGKNIRIDIKEYTAAGLLVGTTSGTSTSATGSWQRLSVTRTLGATGSTVDIQVVAVDALSNTLYVDNVLLEATYALGDYFDGSTGTSGDYRYAWTADANQSSSIAMGVDVESVDGGTGRLVVQSGEWSSTGTRSVRIIPTGSAANTTVEYGAAIASTSPSTSIVALERNKTYTIVGKLRLAAPQTGIIDATKARRIWFSTDGGVTLTSGSTQSANVAGVYTHTLTILTTSTGVNIVHLGNGAEYGGGDVWWDDVMVVEGAYSGPYFDGSITDTTDTTYVWNGVENASTSAITVNPLLNWTGANGAIVYRDSSQSYAGSRSGIVTCTGTVGLQGTKLVSRAVATASTTYFASAWVKGEAGKLIRIELQEWTAAGAYISSSSSANITATGVWQRISVSRTMGATAARADVLITNVAAVAHTFYVDSVMLEASSTLQTYFDGSYPAQGDFSFTWNGAEDASTSQYQAASVNGAVPTGAYAIQSTEWQASGGHSLRVISIAGTAGSAYVDFASLITSGLEPGKTYTVMAKVFRDQAGTVAGTLAYQGYVGSTMTQNITTAVPTTTGLHSVSITFTVAVDIEDATLRIFSNQVKGAPDIWIDQLFVVEGTYTGDYFDGDSDSTVGAFPILYQWDGTPHNSNSIRDVGGNIPAGGAALLTPYGEAERVNSTAALEIKYKSGWLG